MRSAWVIFAGVVCALLVVLAFLAGGWSAALAVSIGLFAGVLVGVALRQLEDYQDVLAYDEAKAEDDGVRIPWEDIKCQLEDDESLDRRWGPVHFDGDSYHLDNRGTYHLLPRGEKRWRTWDHERQEWR